MWKINATISRKNTLCYRFFSVLSNDLNSLNISSDFLKTFQIFTNRFRSCQIFQDPFKSLQILVVFSDSSLFLKILPFKFLWIFRIIPEVLFHIVYRYFQIPADSSKFFQILNFSIDSFKFLQFLSFSFWFSLSDSFEFLQILSKPPSGILKIFSKFSVLFRSFQILSNACRFFQILPDSSNFF